jgi:hypothetical protein
MQREVTVKNKKKLPKTDIKRHEINGGNQLE